MVTVHVATMAQTNPTMAELMRVCFLRAGLSRSKSARPFVLGQPKAWLGTAYHEVLERLPRGVRAGGAIGGLLDDLWKAAVARQVARAGTHPLDARFGSPEKWPGYHLAQAAVRLRAEQLYASLRPAGPPIVTSATPVINEGRESSAMRLEEEFVGCGGRLIGKPDVVSEDGDEIVDYKSGHILEHDEALHADVVKPGYVRQLRIYGYLVRQALGVWPTRGLLLPIAGPGVEVPLAPDDCQQASEEAVQLLDTYNLAVSRGDPVALASPGPQTCRWCPFKTVCGAFWSAADASWSGQLDGAALEALVTGAPARVHGGAAVSLPLMIVAGSEAHRDAHIGPFSLAVFQNAAALSPGDRIRLVGVRVRQDGSLVPTSRTVLSHVKRGPVVVLGDLPGAA